MVKFTPLIEQSCAFNFDLALNTFFVRLDLTWSSVCRRKLLGTQERRRRQNIRGFNIAELPRTVYECNNIIGSVTEPCLVDTFINALHFSKYMYRPTMINWIRLYFKKSIRLQSVQLGGEHNQKFLSSNLVPSNKLDGNNVKAMPRSIHALNNGSIITKRKKVIVGCWIVSRFVVSLSQSISFVGWSPPRPLFPVLNRVKASESCGLVVVSPICHSPL